MHTQTGFILTPGSESQLLYDWRFTSNQFVLVTSPLRITTSIFFDNTCSHSPHVTSSLMRGWVCHLQLLLALSSAVISGPSPVGLMTTFYCLKFETPQTWRTRSLYLYTPGTGWPSYTPRHWVPFSLPPMTRRATVEVFDPVSTRGYPALPELDFWLDLGFPLCNVGTDRQRKHLSITYPRKRLFYHPAMVCFQEARRKCAYRAVA
jgi:hypothetical protein